LHGREKSWNLKAKGCLYAAQRIHGEKGLG
jgi:hypothetical protein